MTIFSKTETGSTVTFEKAAQFESTVYEIVRFGNGTCTFRCIFVNAAPRTLKWTFKTEAKCHEKIARHIDMCKARRKYDPHYFVYEIDNPETGKPVQLFRKNVVYGNDFAS